MPGARIRHPVRPELRMGMKSHSCMPAGIWQQQDAARAPGGAACAGQAGAQQAAAATAAGATGNHPPIICQPCFNHINHMSIICQPFTPHGWRLTSMWSSRRASASARRRRRSCTRACRKAMRRE